MRAQLLLKINWNVYKKEEDRQNHKNPDSNSWKDENQHPMNKINPASCN